MATKKIRLTMDVPVADIHGMVKGKVLDVLERKEGESRGDTRGWWVQGNGERVLILDHEYEIYEEKMEVRE